MRGGTGSEGRRAQTCERCISDVISEGGKDPQESGAQGVDDGTRYVDSTRPRTVWCLHSQKRSRERMRGDGEGWGMEMVAKPDGFAGLARI
ncbi:hypothetical protein C8Q77DRAFT_801349 [Trametes polyzona]|nr:hypothetical protein C8Q77DRAFT_801349 [Trametes polyzona]